MTLRLHLGLLLLGLAWLVGCASPGAPQPPSLRLPKPVQDLSATRKGNDVLLTWTPPTQTTDGENIKHAGKTLVCRTAEATLMIQCGTPAATLADAQVEHWTKSTMVSRRDYTDTLPPEVIQQHPLGFATYALEDENPSGRAAALSNQVRVPLAPTLVPPSKIEAKITPEGVQLEWQAPSEVPQNPALSYFYRVFRQSDNKPELIVGETPLEQGAMSFVDRNIEWEQQYSYRIAAITRVEHAGAETIEVDGADSPSLSVTTHDVFPPEYPTGLQAVYSGVGQKPFIDLTWAPNLEPDLAGYNVYRREAGGEWVKINRDLVKTPAYRDGNVQPGHEYFYRVSAVDQRSNESGKSEETSEKAPQ